MQILILVDSLSLSPTIQPGSAIQYLQFFEISFSNGDGELLQLPHLLCPIPNFPIWQEISYFHFLGSRIYPAEEVLTVYVWEKPSRQDILFMKKVSTALSVYLHAV